MLVQARMSSSATAAGRRITKPLSAALKGRTSHNFTCMAGERNHHEQRQIHWPCRRVSDGAGRRYRCRHHTGGGVGRRYRSATSGGTTGTAGAGTDGTSEPQAKRRRGIPRRRAPPPQGRIHWTAANCVGCCRGWCWPLVISTRLALRAIRPARMATSMTRPRWKPPLTRRGQTRRSGRQEGAGGC